MSSSAIQILSSVGSAPPANAGTAIGSSSVGDDSAPGQQFSQLLGEFGAQTEGEAPQSFASANLLKASAVGSVVAQEIQDIGLNGLSALLQQADELVTPEKAELLLGRVEQLLQGKAHGDPHFGNGHKEALLNIKAQLQGIVRGEEPKILAAIIQTAAATTTTAKEHKLSLTAIFAMLGGKKPSATQKTEEASASTATVQVMPAGIFRTVDGEAAIASAAALEEAKKEQVAASDTITVLTPLAATNLVSTQGYVGEGNASANQAIRDLDAVIAPLKIQGDAALPAVELPSLRDEAKAQQLSMQALAASGAVPKEGAKSNEAGVVISDKSLATFENLLNPSHSNGLSPTQTVRAPQPVQLPYGLVNQAPVTEQVKVAIQQANKDGVEQITIQLDPVDLGRVEVSMRTNREGITQISFMVDKADTFDGLSRDARFLERSLQEAGIKSDTGSMQFNLRQQPQPQLHSDLGGNRQQQGQPQDDDDDVAVSAVSSNMNFTKNYTLNIREGVDISA